MRRRPPFTAAAQGKRPSEPLLPRTAHRLPSGTPRPGCDATDIARQLAARYLPASLRHEVVFKLSGDLIHAIVQLQEQVADATDPLASLDRTQPAWRDALPLPVEDTTVEALLRNLVGHAQNPGTDGTAALALALLSLSARAHTGASHSTWNCPVR